MTQFKLIAREPTEEMIAAGIAQARECTDDFTVAGACVAECLWPVMYDAAPPVELSDEVVEAMARAGQKALLNVRYRRAAQMIDGKHVDPAPGDAMLEDARACLRAALAVIGAK